MHKRFFNSTQSKLFPYHLSRLNCLALYYSNQPQNCLQKKCHVLRRNTCLDTYLNLKFLDTFIQMLLFLKRNSLMMLNDVLNLFIFYFSSFLCMYLNNFIFICICIYATLSTCLDFEER